MNLITFIVCFAYLYDCRIRTHLYLFDALMPGLVSVTVSETFLAAGSSPAGVFTHPLTHPHTHTHTHVGFYGLRGLSIGVMVFILYKLYVRLPYTYPTPKLSPHRRRCISIFPQKNSLCMIYKHFKLWGHWKCPHKSPSPCNTYTHVIIQICVLINHINMHTHTHTHTQSLSHLFTQAS